MPENSLFTTDRVRAIATTLYQDAPTLQRFMARHRGSIAPVAEILNLVPQDAQVLDAGCGIGLLLNVLAHEGRCSAGSAGIDVSGGAITVANRARARLPANTQAADFVARRADDFLPSQQFDCVLLIDVLHHVPSARQALFLRELTQCVRPGGRLIYKDMCRRPRWRASMNRLHDLVMARQWINYFPVEQSEAELNAAGLVCTHRADTRLLWYGHELRVFERPAGDSD